MRRLHDGSLLHLHGHRIHHQGLVGNLADHIDPLQPLAGLPADLPGRLHDPVQPASRHPPVHPHGQVDHRSHGRDQHPAGGRHLVPLRVSGRFLDVGLLRLRSFRIPAPSRIGPGRDRHPGIRSLLPDPRRRGHGPRGRVRIRSHHACEEELRQGAHDLGFHHGDHRRRHRHRRSRHPRRSQRGHDSLLPSHGTAGQEVHGGPGSVLIETYPGQGP